MEDLLGTYKLVLGLEIHMHLNTRHKMFCGCYADIYSAQPNTHTCPSCLGLPGALPVPNAEAVQKTQLLGLALNCKLNEHSRFDRKHYFYPDLPKGYQISQYKQPLCEGTDGIIERIHLEEDTAKSFHEGTNTLIDFNKSGMPLIEIVTKPVFSSVEDAVAFAKKLRDLARYLNVSNADMEKGQMRIEPNISLRTQEMEDRDELPEYKVEVKNINSFKFMEKAVKFEITRQRTALEGGETLDQENRGYDEVKNVTVAQRSKEEAKDYRYFPDPDIPPMVFDESYFEELKKLLPELPDEVRLRLIKQYKLAESVADLLTTEPGISLLGEFEQHAKQTNPIKVANLLLNKKDFRGLSTEEFIQKLTVSEGKVADESELILYITEVIAENVDAVESYKAGKENVLQFLVGQVMRKTSGKADASKTAELLKKHIS